MRYILLLSLVALFFSACNDSADGDNPGKNQAGQGAKEGFTIKGQTAFQIHKPLVVHEILGKKQNVFDTLSVDKDGNLFLSGKVQSPKLCVITIENKRKPFLLQNETITFNIGGSRQNPELSISGSAEVEAMDSVFTLMDSLKSRADAINQRYIMAQNQQDQATLDSLKSEMQDIKASRSGINEQIKSITEGFEAPSFVKLYGSLFLNPSDHYEYLDTLASVYKKKLPDNYYTSQLVQKVEQEKRNQNSPVAVGKKAPDFSIPAPDGETVQLSDYKGKYVLIDFWASWCKPCRHENPHVVKLYKRFKDRDFEIIGVSLDRKKQNWLRAIEQDNLSWVHASQLNGWKSPVARKYHVQSIPHTVLVDPSGEIIAKNLRGERLAQKLQQIFSNS